MFVFETNYMLELFLYFNDLAYFVYMFNTRERLLSLDS